MAEVIEAPVVEPAAAPVTEPAAPVASAPASGEPPGAPSPALEGDPPGPDAGAPASAADLLIEQKPLAETIPEKHRVMKADGTLDEAATLAKVEKHRASLEKKLGSGDTPPAAATDYKLNLPDQFKHLEGTLNPETTKAFRERALGAGLTQSQFDFVMSEWAGNAQALVNGARQLDINTSRAELQKAWGDSMPAQLANVDKALVGYAETDSSAILRDYAADPRIMRMMARIGADMGEATSPKTPRIGAGMTENDVQELMRHPAYSDSKHAEHAAVSAKVRQYFQSRPGANLPIGAFPVS